MPWPHTIPGPQALCRLSQLFAPFPSPSNGPQGTNPIDLSCVQKQTLMVPLGTHLLNVIPTGLDQWPGAHGAAVPMPKGCSTQRPLRGLDMAWRPDQASQALSYFRARSHPSRANNPELRQSQLDLILLNEGGLKCQRFSSSQILLASAPEKPQRCVALSLGFLIPVTPHLSTEVGRLLTQ